MAWPWLKRGGEWMKQVTIFVLLSIGLFLAACTKKSANPLAVTSSDLMKSDDASTPNALDSNKQTNNSMIKGNDSAAFPPGLGNPTSIVTNDPSAQIGDTIMKSKVSDLKRKKGTHSSYLAMKAKRHNRRHSKSHHSKRRHR